jgi:hypothetical protein
MAQSRLTHFDTRRYFTKEERAKKTPHFKYEARNLLLITLDRQDLEGAILRLQRSLERFTQI